MYVVRNRNNYLIIIYYAKSDTNDQIKYSKIIVLCLKAELGRQLIILLQLLQLLHFSRTLPNFCLLRRIGDWDGLIDGLGHVRRPIKFATNGEAPIL